ncbi:MAG: two-component system, OmpR family, phosphate regulon response regulator PhoB [Actinomycetota bacterium]|nr:two-component system, OmpR family, phosphate regulon response regulator PhoB [Actinomycetota bacterium]
MAETGTRILVVDDDVDVRSVLARALGADGYVVDAVADGASARQALSSTPPDLVVLDLGLASEDGLDILAHLRRTTELPVILLTGRAEEQDRILGLKLGADDYLVKPFSPGELSARIGSVLRRTHRNSAAVTTYEFTDLRVDLVTRDVVVRGDHVQMTAKEFDLLAILVASPRQVFDREQLLQQVWSSSSEWQDSATVTEYVRRVRRKIEADPDSPLWLKTVRGVGYRFEPGA